MDTIAETPQEPGFIGWAILELMGHRRLAGFVSEATLAGVTMVRLDIPSEPPATQFYNPKSIYCLTPCSEATARQVANVNRAAPVQPWELPAARNDDAPDTQTGEDDF